MQQNIEIWKDVIGFKGYYQVSNLGRVKSLDRKILKRNQFCEFEKLEKGRFLKQNKLKAGYMQVTLMKNGIPSYKKVHRLVCECFIENNNNYKIINHKDEVKTNNHVENLEWCTSKYNRNYGNSGKICTMKQRNDKSKSKRVNKILNGEIIETFPSCAEVQRIYGFKSSNITACCNNKPHCKSAYGFEWKFV